MTAKYRALLTDQGKALLANAAATGQKLEITQMAVGDGGGSATLPSESQTKLVNEKRRAVLNSLQVNADSGNQVIAEQVIPEDTGGWWIRELGLYDKNGVLVAVANTPDTYKPLLAEGAGRTQVVRMVLLVKGDASAVIVADKTAVLVSRDTLDAAIAEHARSRNHPDATLLAKGFTQLSSDSNSNNEVLAATPKAVKAVNDASLKKTDNLSDLTNKATARGNLALGNAATRNVGTEATNLMEVGAFGFGAGIKHHADAYSNLGEIYRVNNLSKNAPGSGTYGVLNLPCDGGPSSGYLAIQNSAAAYIGISTVPEKPLSWYRIYTTAYKPTAADVGAYSKAEADGKFVKQSGDIMTGELTGQYNGPQVFSEQYNSKAAFYGEFSARSTNAYSPLIKQKITIENKSSWAISQGSLALDGSPKWLMQFRGSAGQDIQFSWSTEGDFIAPKSLKAGNTLFVGNANMTPDGNIWGTRWNPNGQWLWDAIVANINAARDAVWGHADQAANAAQNNAKDWAYQNLIQGVRLSGRTVIADTGGRMDLPSGCVYSGMSGANYNPGVWGAYSAIQVVRNGQWVTIGTE
ncbi:phage tail protein [Serratia quinivorans]|uniref:phage tail protein n=1 Tax=Serratia quinivorans TaxID=137545 RepID=UPI00217913ED|nr:phage tail protein [Serratia quinivorans]CAI1133359.1 Phage tail fibre repeat [Serratia quinivorans]CAI1912150.1 Phage tail fibre repeat [Serratia quinivorans]